MKFASGSGVRDLQQIWLQADSHLAGPHLSRPSPLASRPCIFLHA